MSYTVCSRNKLITPGGCSKKKLYLYLRPISGCFRDRAVLLYSSKTVDKQNKLYTVSNTGIHCLIDKYSLPSKTYIRKFHLRLE
jgi:hypothetical protein